MNMNRRWFLRNAGAFGAAFASTRLAFGRAAGPRRSSAPDLGDLVSDPDGVLDLPKDFAYQVLSRTGEDMDDGLIVPGAPDGMAAFPGENGKTRLVRNHELMLGEDSPYGYEEELFERVDPKLVYDAGVQMPCGGGTTTLVYDTRTKKLERQFLSLAGTLRNCAGGPTPWGTWVTCEEAPVLADQYFAKDHGYAFEVDASADGLVAPVPLLGMGRFNHEAVAVDPASGTVYQTEDRPDGLIYRFLPKEKGKLAGEGRLQALAIRENPSVDTRNKSDFADFPAQDPIPVEWVDLDEVQAPEDDLRYRGFLAGAARFARPEGMWTGDGVIWFACTSGGRAGAGQIFRYKPSSGEGDPQAESEDRPTLELFLESQTPEEIDYCDNLTVCPWGDLLLCEDGTGDNFLVRVTQEGAIHPFARTSVSELAGATFSPDGTTLFVNIQRPGITLAITGPWPKS